MKSANASAPAPIPLLRNLARAALALITPSLLAAVAHASYFGFNQLEIDFARAEDAATKAEWSDTIGPVAGGLGWNGPAHDTRGGGWIKTKPFAVGYRWRAAPEAKVQVTVLPVASPTAPASSEVAAVEPLAGAVYARYSADRVHWTSWQWIEQKQRQIRDELVGPAAATMPLNPDYPIIAIGLLRPPRRESADFYRNKMSDYAKLDVPWASDEDALARWIVAKQPDYFAQQIPFVGYVEFLFEHDFHGGRPIASLKADVTYGMSGRFAVARDPKADTRTDTTSPWRFTDDTPTRPAASE